MMPEMTNQEKDIITRYNNKLLLNDLHGVLLYKMPLLKITTIDRMLDTDKKRRKSVIDFI